MKMKVPEIIRRWFAPTCTVSGCQNPKPKLTAYCEQHKSLA